MAAYGEVIARATSTFWLPPPSGEPIAPSLRGFDQMVRPAQASAIGNVERCATVMQLYDVIGEHSMRRLRLGTAITVGNDLTPTAGTANDLCPPCPELRRGVEGVARLEPLQGRTRRRWLDRARVGLCHKQRQ
jgi:hypothetical protein